MALEHAKSTLSSVSTRIPSKSYGFDSTQKRSHGLNLDPRIANRLYRLGSKDHSFGISTRIDAGPVAKDDGGSNNDNHSLLEMGDIAVKSGWEVTRERRSSGRVPISHSLGKPSHCRNTIITGDNVV